MSEYCSQLFTLILLSLPLRVEVGAAMKEEALWLLGKEKQQVEILR